MGRKGCADDEGREGKEGTCPTYTGQISTIQWVDPTRSGESLGEGTKQVGARQLGKGTKWAMVSNKAEENEGGAGCTWVTGVHAGVARKRFAVEVRSRVTQEQR